MDIRFRVKKTLGNSENYVQQHEIESKFSSYVDLLLDNMLGIYVNDLQSGDFVFVNEKGGNSFQKWLA